jgi:predicted enzyme related to lactoylglutathione lyase
VAAKKTTTFAFTKLVVADLEASGAFYEALCGYEPGREFASDVVGGRRREIAYRDPTGGSGIILISYEGGLQPPPTGLVLGFNTSDIEGDQARIIGMGGSVVEEIRSVTAAGWTMRVGYFADHAGNVLELVERVAAD